MKKFILTLFLFTLSLFLSGCKIPPGQAVKHTTPGHIQKYTGCNPKSGKCKAKHVTHNYPSFHTVTANKAKSSKI